MTRKNLFTSTHQLKLEYIKRPTKKDYTLFKDGLPSTSYSLNGAYQLTLTIIKEITKAREQEQVSQERLPISLQKGYKGTFLCDKKTSDNLIEYEKNKYPNKRTIQELSTLEKMTYQSLTPSGSPKSHENSSV